MSGIFRRSLINFTNDFANGDAIRSLANKGMTVNEIAENLTFPAAISVIQNTVWKHYLNTGVIKLEEPEDDKGVAQITSEFVLERDRYGKSSFRKVERQLSEMPVKYVACDFGKRIYQDRDLFLKDLENLEKSDMDYILGLPWPIERVYHILDARMERINANLK